MIVVVEYSGGEYDSSYEGSFTVEATSVDEVKEKLIALYKYAKEHKQYSVVISDDHALDICDICDKKGRLMMGVNSLEDWVKLSMIKMKEL
jgi:hypothetical protein